MAKLLQAPFEQQTITILVCFEGRRGRGGTTYLPDRFVHQSHPMNGVRR